MFKPPSLLAIQVIPTATVFLLGSHGVFIRAEHVSLPPHAPDMLSVRNEQLTEGEFHPMSLTALSAAPARDLRMVRQPSHPTCFATDPCQPSLRHAAGTAELRHRRQRDAHSLGAIRLSA